MVIQAMTGKVYMGGLGVVPAFSLADLRKKSKPICTESWKHGQQVCLGTLVASAGLVWDTWQKFLSRAS